MKPKVQMKAALNAQRDALRARGWLLSPTLLNSREHRHRVQYYYYARAFEGNLTTEPHVRIVYSLSRQNEAWLRVDLLAPNGETEVLGREALDPSNPDQAFKVFSDVVLDPTNLRGTLQTIEARITTINARIKTLRERIATMKNRGAL